MSTAEMKKHPAAKPDWNNLAVLHKNTLPPRANFYIWDSLDDALSYDINKSRLHSLSGMWMFNHARNPFTAPVGFEAPSYKLDSSQWHEMKVPGMWQLNGYGKGPQYTNVNFPIPMDPPHVPLDNNETGSYIKRFSVPEALKDRQVRLRFEGVDAAFHVWVNGVEVGYHQGSRNPAEFDITTQLKVSGDNILAVRVYEYCDGTYIEDQDQWRMSGIFRDVYLLGFPRESRIEDLFVQTKLDSQYVDATLNVRVDLGGSGEVKLDLYGLSKDQPVATASKSGSGSIGFSLEVKDPSKWTAETPTLYHLVVSLDNETFVSQRIGIRQIDIKGGIITVNGKRIVLRGANRHEHHPKFGRSVPYEFMKRDLLLMKEYNINAIRTCHQPSDVRLYDLADELGFWVLDEADLECHGFEIPDDISLQIEEPTMPYAERQAITYGTAARWTTDNPDWEAAYVDRAMQLVKRDQLHPSVIIWSLGNEAFFGRNVEAMYDWIKHHYEPDWDAKKMDMHSRMYTSVEQTVELAGKIDKPLILCEYIHAMGNGPGGIKEYVETFFTYPNIQGGFVWEWANHGLLTKDSHTGEEFYGYGGDFGETLHDGNFCMDGALFSDHTPTPGLVEYKKALEPVKIVRVTSSPKRSAEIVNRYDFISLDHLECRYDILCEGTSVHNGTINIPDGVAPGQTAQLELPTDPPGAVGEIILRLSFRLRAPNAALPANFEVAFDSISYGSDAQPLAARKTTTNDTEDKISVEEAPTLLIIRSSSTTWTFSPIDGQIVDLVKKGTSFLSSGPIPTFYRALTDNDGPEDGAEWHRYKLHLATVTTRGCSFGFDQQAGNGAKFDVHVEQRFAPTSLNWSIDLHTIYSFHAHGSVSIRVKGTPTGNPRLSTLPRIGLTMELPKEWGSADSETGAAAVAWYGRGPGESYSDKKLSQREGVYTAASVDELWTDYEYPQEGGNRTDTRWVAFTHGVSGQSITAQFVDLANGDSHRKLFNFQVSHYRVGDVDAAKHPYELHKRKTENVILRLDAEHHGIGSGACGPRPGEEYVLRAEEFEFEVVLA